MSNAPIPEDIAAHLLSLEQALLDPALRRDRARVSELLTEDFVEFGSSGRKWTRPEILDLLATEEYIPPVIENFECHPIAAGVVLATYSNCTRQRTERSPHSGSARFHMDKFIWCLAGAISPRHAGDVAKRSAFHLTSRGG